MKINVALSPCPNDTFAFDAWINKKIHTSIDMQPVFADIQQLNTWAYNGLYPVMKISAHCFGHITSAYSMIPAGAAIQQGGGPKLVANKYFTIDDVRNMTIAVPGFDTTACLLLQVLLPPPKKIVPVRYDEIMRLVQQGAVDAGVLIHEARFLIAHFDLCELADFGTLFFEQFKSLLPLGVVVAKRSLKKEQLIEITKTLQQSIAYAKNEKRISSFVQEHSQEKSLTIIKQHIDTYVTKETEQLSAAGLRAVKTFFEIAIEKELLPKDAKNFDCFCNT